MLFDYLACIIHDKHTTRKEKGGKTHLYIQKTICICICGRSEFGYTAASAVAATVGLILLYLHDSSHSVPLMSSTPPQTYSCHGSYQLDVLCSSTDFIWV